MKTVLLCALMINATTALAATKLLEYSYGNQDTASTLVIYDDGAIEHGERTCCPSRNDMIAEPALPAARINQLKNQISSVTNGTLNQHDGEKSADNSYSGSLRVFANGRPVIVYDVDRNPITGGYNSITENEAPEAKQIIALAESYTKIDLGK